MVHDHVYHPGRKQLTTGEGKRLHPTVKEGWVSSLFCACGAECPPEQQAAVRAQMKAVADSMPRWGVEHGAQQGPLPL